MNGQWFGAYSGSSDGLLVVEIDDAGPEYHAALYAMNNDPKLPTTTGELVIPKGPRETDVRIPLFAAERGSGNIFSEDGLKKQYPSVTAPKYADAHISFSEKEIKLRWTTDIGTHGSSTVKQNVGDGVKASHMSWNEFKAFATGLDRARFLFRGQESSEWKLRTSFHRSGRSNIAKFMQVDIPALYRHLSGLTQHRFNFQDPSDYAAFLALIQHHGYPTPLLDWTMSPFVAAYFAFRNPALKNAPRHANVRIFAFNAFLWNHTFERAQALMPAYLHMTVLEPLALDNPRILPQQGYFLVTNIDDIEGYFGLREQSQGSGSFLTAIDIPSVERPKVLRELELMGINAGSLFPGIDGVCQQMRERFFEIF